MTNSYSPGLHALGELKTVGPGLMKSHEPFREMIGKCISALELHTVGEVYHNFPGGGFTAVICLTESHISIHTWPEFGRATLDVFLSNYEHVNDEKAREIFRRCAEFFGAELHNYHELTR